MKAAALALLMIATAGAARADDYSFDAADFEKKSFEFSGYAEIKQEALRLRPDSVAYRLAYPEAPPRQTLDRSTGTLELSGKWHADPWLLDFRGRASYATDALQSVTERGTLLDGGVRWSPTESLSLDVGKRSQRWGKGYAWNPVGFVERPKDPNDTQLAREGYYMAGGEWVKSLEGALSALSVTALVVPTRGEVNADFGKPGELNPALKLYGLIHDTDVDLYWLGEGSKPQRVGVDFSRNLGANLEVHGEWARTLDAARKVVSAGGAVVSSVQNQDSYLIGMRYITERELTWIAEYYRNGAGYSAGELKDFYEFADTALSASASAQQASKALGLAQSGYGRANPGRDYFYLRASANEPFGWLYTTLTLTSIVNLGDHSRQLTPEIGYTGFTNLELRARVIFASGNGTAEFSQKTAGRRFEAYARFYF